MPIVRKYTDKLLEAIEDGLLSKDDVICEFCAYMSEAAIEDMVTSAGWFDEDEEVEHHCDNCHAKVTLVDGQWEDDEGPECPEYEVNRYNPAFQFHVVGEPEE